LNASASSHRNLSSAVFITNIAESDFSVHTADLLAQLKILDGHIGGRDWFALNRFTIADIALGSIVKRCLEFPIERPAYSELERWQAAIDARPAFAVAIGAKPSVLTPAA
jgi:glutathione S-transferase